MICENCRWEADYVPLDSVDPGVVVLVNGHADCKGGTHCFCQHKPVGSHSEVKK